MSWHTVKLEQIASIKGGKRLPKGHEFTNSPTEHLYIRARDIGNNGITISEPVYISDNTYNKLKQYTVNEGDIIVTIVGANIGDVGYVTIDFVGANLTENAAKITVDRSICNPKFISAQLSHSHVKEKFQFIGSGSAQGKLGLYKIKSFDATIPSIPIQNNIVKILSAYDDLIENNKRRIALLEESARLLYKEWFVYLRFPGHEHVKVVDGVPEGWEKKKLSDKCVLNYGKALKADNRVDGQYPVYGSSGVIGFHEKALVRGPGIIVGRKGNVGSVYWSDVDFHPIDTVYYITDEEISFYLFNSLQHMNFISSDVAVPGLNRDYAYSKDYIEPASKLYELFEETVTPVYEQVFLLQRYNDKLAKARDLLLPRLMNGEIAV